MREFVAGLLPTEEEDAVGALLDAGDEASLRQVLELEPGHAEAVVALAELLVADGDDAATDEALALLARIPETAETRRVAALARVGADVGDDEVTAELDGAARPGEGRRRRPPAVPRPARAARARRPPHRRRTASRSPAASSRPARSAAPSRR